MSALIYHVFNNAHTDGSDATLVNPSSWNDGHKLTGGANGSIVVRDTSDAVYGSTYVAAAAGALVCTGAGARPTWSNGAAGTVLVGGASPVWVPILTLTASARLNPARIDENFTIPGGYNGLSAGPIDVGEGVVIDVADHATWSIV